MSNELVSLYLETGFKLNKVELPVMDLKFYRGLDLYNQNIFTQKLCLYIQVNLKRNHGSYLKAQTIELSCKLLGTTSRVNFYNSIKYLIDNKVLIKVNPNTSEYYVNPQFINVMSKSQQSSLYNDCYKLFYEDIMSNNTTLI